MGMKKMPRHRIRAAKMPAIFSIAKNRVTHACKVQTNLMFTARLRLTMNKSHFTARRLYFPDCFGVTPLKIAFKHSLLLCRNAIHRGNITLFYLSFAKHLHQCVARTNAFRNDQSSGGVAVKPMDRKDLRAKISRRSVQISRRSVRNAG